MIEATEGSESGNVKKNIYVSSIFVPISLNFTVQCPRARGQKGLPRPQRNDHRAVKLKNKVEVPPPGGGPKKTARLDLSNKWEAASDWS